MGTKEFWETVTVVCTVVSAVFALLGFIKKLWPWAERISSFLGAVFGVAAALALVNFTYLNRISEEADKEQVTIAANKAQTAIANLDKEEKEQNATQQQLTATEEQSAGEINRLNMALEQSDERLVVQQLISRMYSDDAVAYDQLTAMKAFSDSAQEQAVRSAVQQVFDSHNVQGNQYNGNAPRPPAPAIYQAELLPFLSLKDAADRENILRELVRRNKEEARYMPKLVSLATTDPSLDVRTLATIVINVWTGNRFHPLDKRGFLQNWWNNNRGTKEFPVQ
jgi:hypothetical protein